MTGAEVLIGAKAIAQERLDRESYSKIDGELWRARAHAAYQAINSSRVVEVQAASGMTLIVRPAV